MEFLTIFGKVVAKNRAFGNNIIFLQQFFPFRGGGTFPMFPHCGGAYVDLDTFDIDSFTNGLLGFQLISS